MNRLITKTFGNELKKITRNKRSVLVLFGVPALAIMLMIYLMNMGKGTEIYLKAEDSGICKVITDRYGTEYQISDSAKATDILITVSDTIEIVYDQTQVSAKRLNEAKRVAAEIAADLQGSEYAEAFMAGEPDIKIIDIATVEEKYKSSHMRNLAFLATLAIMFGGMNIITISSDSFAGEKERGVYDSIILSGADEGAWFIGKQLAVFTMAFLVFVFEIAFGYFGNVLLKSPMAEAFQASINAKGVTELLISAIGCGLIFTGLFSAISISFDTVKNASSYSTIAMFAFSFLACLPLITDAPWTAKIPFANFPTLCLRIMGGKSSMTDVLLGLAISAGIYAAATVTAISLTKIRERRK